MPTLTTDRLVLREFVEDDWSAMLAIHAREDVVRFLSFEAMDETAARAYVQGIMVSTREVPRMVFEFAITLPGDDTMIGRTGLRRDEDPRSANLWFTVDPAHHGKGYAVEAARALLGLAIETVGLHRVWGACDPRNVASARVMDKLGMRREGHHVQDVFIKDEWCDSVIFAILAVEWQTR